MDQFLKDSPSEMGNFDFNNSSNYRDRDDSNDYNNNNNPNYGQNFNKNQDNFSLNLEQGYDGNKTTFDDFDNQQFPEVPGNEFMSPKGNTYGNDNDFESSFNQDLFLEDFDANYPTHTFSQHNQSQSQSHPPLHSHSRSLSQNNLQQNYINPQQPNTVNLDELISPGNNAGNGEISFLDSQYLSNPSKDSNMTRLSNNFSPDYSRQGSISAPYQNANDFDLTSGSYLSPQQQFMSPGSSNFNNSLDTLTSPNNHSYLNSPPQYNHRIPNYRQNFTSSSIPNRTNNFLSPPQKSSLGTSAPGPGISGDDTQSQHGIDNSSKQLSKEEKLKRRREFHNAVERRRRDLIKERIKDLGLLVPPSLLNPQLIAVQTFQKTAQLNSNEINELLSTIKVKETKPNKSTILNKSVDYVNHLQYVLQQQEKAMEELSNKIDASIPQMGGASMGKNSNTNNVDNHNNTIDNNGNSNQNNPNFLQDFQEQSKYGQRNLNQQSFNDDQFQLSIKTEDQQFDPDEFFLEVITGSNDNNSQDNNNINNNGFNNGSNNYF